MVIEESEECGDYFAQKVAQALQEIVDGIELPEFDTVEALFEYLDRDEIENENTNQGGSTK